MENEKKAVLIQSLLQKVHRKYKKMLLSDHQLACVILR